MDGRFDFGIAVAIGAYPETLSKNAHGPILWRTPPVSVRR
jgi:hypothetical protein